MRKPQCALVVVALCVGMVQSWDIAISAGDVIEFYTNGTKTNAVQFKSRNLTALAYDEVHNMMLFVDKQNDSDYICGYNLSSEDITCFVKRSGGNIYALTFDPVTELLFFTDTNEKSINWISLKTSAREELMPYGNPLMKMNDRTPTDIALDSCSGYLYWTISKNDNNIIERAQFNGSNRKVLNPNYYTFSFAIDQQTQKMYFFDGRDVSKYFNSADFDGGLFSYDSMPSGNQKALTVSKDYLYWMNSSVSYQSVWQMPKNPIKITEIKEFGRFYNNGRIDIAVNYKLKDQIQGIPNCEALTNVGKNNSDGQIHAQVNGQSVCDSYCLHGNCSYNGEGLPKCRCDTGYHGERCEMNACHDYCLNNGTCSLNENSEPVCQCVGDYNGDRCDVSDCLNYCIQGSCSFDDQGRPKCSCNAGYSGMRCEVNVCLNYCLHGGACSLSEEDAPVCRCVGGHEGPRCEAVTHHSVTNTTSSGSTYYSAGRNVTLADLLANWRKPTKVTVTVEV